MAKRKKVFGKAETRRALGAVVSVALAAAASVWALTWWNSRQVAAGRGGLGGLGFSALLIGGGVLSLAVKRLRPIAAPLLMVGATLGGVEAVRSVGPMNGLAARYRRGQARPAAVTAGMDRPASVTAGMDRPAEVAGGNAWRRPSGGRAPFGRR